MLTDYKFTSILRGDDNVEVNFRVYEGDVTSQSERNIDGVEVAITRYRRSLRLNTTNSLFAAGTSDGAIRVSLNDLLGTDRIRQPIPEQVNA